VGMKTCTDDGKTATSCLSGYANAGSSFNGYCVACADGASTCTLPSAV